MGARKCCTVIEPEFGHVSDQEGQIVPQRAFDCSSNFDAIAARYGPGERALALDPDYVENKSVMLRRFRGCMSAQLVVTMPNRMNVTLKGVNTIANITISAGDDPGAVVECHSSKFIKFSASDGLTHVFLVMRHAFRQGVFRNAFWGWT
ncbi:hypothetical protein HG530_011809 [Fusarium avenaceum]|nr:hypothetical protein HG530_011809 [Fusarium avenaceum]